jgi:quercetin dioxygenase-like cupin family protein
VHHVGTIAETAPAIGAYEGHSSGHTRQPLIARPTGSVHQAVTAAELAPGGSVDRHLHAFEQAVCVLEGALELSVAGTQQTLGPDDYAWVEVGVPHAVSNSSGQPARWLEISAPQPGASLDDTVFAGDGVSGAEPDVPFRTAHFDVDQLPAATETFGLAGFGGGNVGGASVKLLIDKDFGASQLNLMALRYMPDGFIKEHDHAFEEAFFFVEGEIDVVLDGEPYTLRAGDYCWSSVGGMHAMTNRSGAPVRWIETQVPQPPSRHQARFRGDWERLAAGG